MPWKIFKDGNKHCIYKIDDQNRKVGKSKGCHDHRADAVKQMKAMYANSDEEFALAIGEHAVVHVELQTGSESISEQLNRIIEAWDHMRYQPQEPMYAFVREVFGDYIIVEKDNQLFKVSYTTTDDKIVFADQADWKRVRVTYTEMTLGVFVELQGIAGAFDGLAASSDVPFISMMGEEIFVEPQDLATYIENGLAVIESTRETSGDVVGLPIDLNGHDHKGGAGWIKGFELDNARNIVRFLVEWTEEGANLIKNGLRKFFSPSVDVYNKTILGGSLTNWPASRDSVGRILLRPIELSSQMNGIDMPPTLEQLMADIEEMKTKLASVTSLPSAATTQTTAAGIEQEEFSQEMRSLLGNDDRIEELGELAQRRAMDILRVESRKRHVVEFVSQVVGGTPAHPVGLPIRASELTKLLLSLPEKQSIAVEKLLQKVWSQVMDFSEHGIAGVEDFSLRRAVPTEYQSLLQEWVAGGRTPQSFFAANPEAGRAEDFNLAPYLKQAEV